MADPPDNLIREIKMFWKIVSASIPFLLFGIIEDSIVFKIGRRTEIPFWLAVIAVMLPLSMIFAYLQNKVFKK